jgi:hypothetical protein
MTFERLTQDEVTHVLSLLPAVVYQQLQRENVVLAGGAIRDTLAGIPVKDIDIFCHSEEQAARLALELAPFARHTTFAYTVPLEGLPVQYVYYKDFTTPEDLVQQFDFRACCAGIYWTATPDARPFPPMWVGLAVEGFHADVEARVLRFMSQLKDAGKLTALRRALDFVPKGWTISNEDLTGILTHFEPSIQPDRARRSFRPCYGRL